MPRGEAAFETEELANVLSRYDIGTIRQNEPLIAGNQRAPKRLLVTDRGRFILKRRPPGKDDPYNVSFAHAVQLHLARKGMAVGTIILTRDSSTALHLNQHVYELFEYIPGCRCDGSPDAIADSGRQLARFHIYLDDFVCTVPLPRRTYHDSSAVRGYLKTIRGSEWENKPPPDELKTIAHQLLLFYNRSSVNVNQQGFDSWPEQIVHNDWHPGNLLFQDRRVVCILDFDSVRTAPGVTDVANGALQFSIVGDRPNPVDWPPYLDQAKMGYFMKGYVDTLPLSQPILRSIPDLMIELMIAEAVHPIAATGFFGHLSGLDFLRMILRKSEWIDENRSTLYDVISG